jgi:hypothetical protein
VGDGEQRSPSPLAEFLPTKKGRRKAMASEKQKPAGSSRAKKQEPREARDRTEAEFPAAPTLAAARLVLSEAQPASRRFLVGLPAGHLMRFTTGPEILTLVSGGPDEIPPAVAAEAYVPLTLSSRELQIRVGEREYERIAQRLGRLLLAFLQKRGYLVGSGQTRVTPDAFELAPMIRDGLPLYLSPAVIAAHKRELFGALSDRAVLTYLYNEAAEVTADHLAYAEVVQKRGATTAAGVVPFPDGSGVALGPGAELLGLTWFLPPFPPVVPQLNGTLRNVPGSTHDYDPFAVSAANFDEAQNLGIVATNFDLSQLQYPPTPEAAAAVRGAKTARNSGWRVVESRAVMSFARLFFEGEAPRPLDDVTFSEPLPLAEVPLAIGTFDEQLKITKPCWAARLPPCDFMAVTDPFLAAAAAAARQGDLPLCPLVGSWLNFAKARDLENCFVLPPPLAPPSRRPRTWNDGLDLLSRSEADFEDDLRLALALPLFAAYYSLFPGRAGDFGSDGLRVGEDLKFIAPLSSLAEASLLVQEAERFAERPGLRLRLARFPSRAAGVAFRRQVQRAAGSACAPAGSTCARSFLLPRGAADFVVAYAQLEDDEPPISESVPLQASVADLRAEMGEYLRGRCHNEAGAAQQPFEELSLEEQLDIVVLESSPPYCLEAGVIAAIPPLNPFTRNPLTWGDELRAQLARAGAEGLFDVGVLRGILRGLGTPSVLLRGSVSQDASPQGVLLTIVADGGLRPRFPDRPARSNWRVELLELVPENGGLLSEETMSLAREAWRRGLFLSRWGRARALAAGSRFPEQFGDNWLRGDLNLGTEARLVSFLRAVLQLGTAPPPDQRTNEAARREGPLVAS